MIGSSVRAYVRLAFMHNNERGITVAIAAAIEKMGGKGGYIGSPTYQRSSPTGERKNDRPDAKGGPISQNDHRNSTGPTNWRKRSQPFSSL